MKVLQVQLCHYTVNSINYLRVTSSNSYKTVLRCLNVMYVLVYEDTSWNLNRILKSKVQIF